MRQLVVWLFLIIVTGCSSVIDVKSVNIATNLTWQVQPASAMAQSIEQTVLLTATHSGNRYKMLVSTQSKPDLFAMVAMTTQGVPLFELKLDKFGDITKKTYVPLPISAEYILSDMQIINLSIEALRANLAGNNVVVETSFNDKKRTIRVEGSKVIDIEYKHNMTHFIHHQRDYELLIEVLRQ